MLQDISFLFGCFGGAAIYWTLSYLFPAQETFIQETIFDLEVDGSSSREVTTDDKTSTKEYTIVDKA